MVIRRTRGPGPMFLAATLVLFSCVPVYLAGLIAGGLFSYRPTDELCPGKALADDPTGQRILPLSYRCQFDDGTARELVPAWVNPVLALLAAGAVVLIVIGVRAAVRHRRAGVPAAVTGGR